jgi:hypothetical protein
MKETLGTTASEDHGALDRLPCFKAFEESKSQALVYRHLNILA